MKQVNILVVATQPHMPDVRGVALQQTLQDDLHLRVDEVRTAALYTIHAPLTPADLEEARQVLFTDAVVQESFWAQRPPMTCDWIVQVGLLPTDPALPMARVIGWELEILGSHGMPAHAYPELLALVSCGRLEPGRLVTREIGLEAAAHALRHVGETPGITVITQLS